MGVLHAFDYVSQNDTMRHNMRIMIVECKQTNLWLVAEMTSSTKVQKRNMRCF
jgi:hypothetical protein